MEVAALPGNRREHGLPRRLHSRVVVTHYQRHAVHAPIHQAREERPPVNLGFASRNRHPDHLALACGIDSYSLQYCGIYDGTVHADSLIFRIYVENRIASKGPLPEQPYLLVERLRRIRHLRGTDFEPAHFFEDVLHLAGGDSLDVHLRHGERQRPLGTKPLCQRSRVEVAVPCLRYRQDHGSGAHFDRLRLEAVGVAQAAFGTLVRTRVQECLPFQAHRLVHGHPEEFHQKIGSLVDQGFQNCRVKTIFVFGVLHI